MVPLLLHIHAKGDDERGGSHRFLPALSPGRPPASMELRPITRNPVKICSESDEKGVCGHPSLCGDGGMNEVHVSDKVIMPSSGSILYDGHQCAPPKVYFKGDDCCEWIDEGHGLLSQHTFASHI